MPERHLTVVEPRRFNCGIIMQLPVQGVPIRAVYFLSFLLSRRATGLFLDPPFYSNPSSITPFQPAVHWQRHTSFL